MEYAALHGLNFMERFVKESLRSWGISFLERTCTKDYYVPELNITIPKGALVQIPGASIMHEEEYYPDPETFDPDRHFDSSTLNPATFFTFGQGPRNCVGFRFAWTIMRALLVTVLANYKLLPGPGMSFPLEIDPKNPSGMPKGGVHVKLVARK